MKKPLEQDQGWTQISIQYVIKMKVKIMVLDQNM